MDNINRWGITYKMHRPHTACDTLLSIHRYRMSDITQVEEMHRSQYYSQHQIVHILKSYKLNNSYWICMIGLDCYRICCTASLQSLFCIATIGMPFFRCFSRDSVEGILAALEAEGNNWGNKYLEVRLALSINAIILCLQVML